jgi:hypothetical protein
MTRLTHASRYICLLLVLVTIPAFGQSQPSESSPTLSTYRLPESLDANTTKAVLETLLTDRRGVKLTLDLAQKRIVALGQETDHRTIVDALDILQNPIRVDADTYVSQPTRSGKFLRVYALNDSAKSIAKTMIESILADHEGVRLAVDSNSGNLVVFAAGTEHDLIAQSLGELLRSTPDASSESEPVDASRNIFVIHSFENQPLLLNSRTGDTWILKKTEESRLPTWTRIIRDN